MNQQHQQHAVTRTLATLAPGGDWSREALTLHSSSAEELTESQCATTLNGGPKNNCATDPAGSIEIARPRWGEDEPVAQPPRPCDKSQPIAAAEGGKLAARGCAKGCACGPAGVLVAWRAHMALCRVFEAEKMTFGLHRRRHEAILEVRGRGRKRERGGARGAKWRNLVATFAQQIARRKDGAAAGGPDLHRRQ